MQLIVLGMHRSGTSVVSRLLNLMGAYFGPEGVATDANEENPKGFWERRDVRALNDSILHSIGCDWDRLATFDLERIPHGVLADFNRAASKLVLAMDGHRPWFVKEPRLMLLLPLWLPHLEAPVCIHVRRQPIETAASLLSRNRIALPVGLALWEVYKRLGLAASAGLPTVHVAHRHLMTDPRTATDQFLSDLTAAGVVGLREPTAREIEGFIDVKLYREQESRMDLGEYRNTPQYELYRRIDAGTPIDDDPEWRERTRAVLAEYERSLPPLMARLQARVGEADQQLAEATATAKAERDRANRLKAASLKQEAREDEMQRLAGQLQAELAAARQALAESRSELERVHSLLEAERQLAAGLRPELVLARAEVETERRVATELRSALSASQASLEQANAQWRSAASTLEREQATSQELKAAVEAGARQLEDVRRAREAAERQLDAARREIDTWRADSVAQAARLRETGKALRQAQESSRDGSREIVQLTRLLVASEASAAQAGNERDIANAELARLEADRSSELATAGAEIARLRAELADRPAGLLSALARRLRALVGRGDPLARDRALILESGWFDADWYRATYPDVAASGMDCAEHFLRHGGAEGRRPGPRFDSEHYLAANADVAAANLNPLVHFLRHGMAEGRAPLAARPEGTEP